MHCALFRREMFSLKSIFFVILIFSLLFPLVTFAQSAAPTPGAPDGNTPPFPVIPDVSPAPRDGSAETAPTVSVVVASVELYNATIENQDGNTVTVGFDLVNTKGIQPNVQYAIQVFKSEKSIDTKKSDVQTLTFTPRTPVDTQIYDEKLTLAENVLIHRSVTYTAPASLTGDYEVRVNAFSSVSLLTLGLGNAGTVTLTGNGETVAPANEPDPLSPAMEGKEATIRNITLDKDWYQAGDTANIFFFGVAYIEGKVSVRVQMTSGDKAFCSEPTEKIFDNSSLIADMNLAITARCVNPIITAQILDEQGTILDSAIFTVTTSSTVPEAAMSQETGNQLPWILLIGLGAAVLLGLFIALRHKRGGSGTGMTGGTMVSAIIFFTLFAAGMGTGAQPADAATLTNPQFMFWGKCSPNKFVQSTYTVYLNKSSYAPGESIIASWSLATSGTTDSKYLLNDSDYYRGNFFTRIAGIVNGEQQWGEVNTGSVFGGTISGTNYFTAPTSPGNYNAEFGGTYYSYYDGTGGVNYLCGPFDPYHSMFIPYSVVASIPATPGWFSASCPSPGTTASGSWASASGATYYSLRLDNTSNSWNGSCTSPNPGDGCADIPAPTTSISGVSTISGASYHAWVRACNASGCSGQRDAWFT
ncbi:MAG: hypothetical protein WAW00_01560, partial [Candidatus Moraniibacteriota bacterium]